MEDQIIYQNGPYWLTPATFGKRSKTPGFAVMRDGATAAERVASIGYAGTKGLMAGIFDVDRRAAWAEAAANDERGAVSLPLLTFQACAAIGLASGLWSLYLRLVAQIGGLGL